MQAQGRFISTKGLSIFAISLSSILLMSCSGERSQESNPIAAPLKTDALHIYMVDVKSRIRKAWVPPKGTEAERVLIVFGINKDGTVKNLRLIRPSKTESVNEAAKRAVENAAPFPPLPESAGRDFETVFQLNEAFLKGP